MIHEIERKLASNYGMIAALFIAHLLTLCALILAIQAASAAAVIATVILAIVILVLWFSLFMVHPNESKVLQLFGKYVGTARESGLRWANPFYQKTVLSENQGIHASPEF